MHQSVEPTIHVHTYLPTCMRTLLTIHSTTFHDIILHYITLTKLQLYLLVCGFFHKRFPKISSRQVVRQLGFSLAQTPQQASTQAALGCTAVHAKPHRVAQKCMSNRIGVNLPLGIAHHIHVKEDEVETWGESIWGSALGCTETI